ncbi:tyrosine-type recombinase/integrase [Streptomyces sp. CY1]|uniref:tyrosine-type recombinase/integrase n=1 Tax=Streptomyces sp. CY1 TaxID=3388313 RepID=UPI0039A282DB
MTRAEFNRTAEPLPMVTVEALRCRICPDRPAWRTEGQLCFRHAHRWRFHLRDHGQDANFDDWLSQQRIYDGYGGCRTAACPELANSALGLCPRHESRYRTDNRPGRAFLPPNWFHTHEMRGLPVPVVYEDEAAFLEWCANTNPIPRPGRLSLLGLRPLIAAEFKWGLAVHTQGRRARWEMAWVQRLVDFCRRNQFNSLIDIDLQKAPVHGAMIAGEIIKELRLVYFTPVDTREAGFIETDHFGIRFQDRSSHFDLTAVSQVWLRNLLWDFMADTMRSPKCPRTSAMFDNMRRAIVQLSAFLQVEAPQGGEDPTLLEEEHMLRFVADVRHREREGLPSLGLLLPSGESPILTATTRRFTFNGVRKLLRGTLETGEAERLGLDRAFVAYCPHGGEVPRKPRSPFPDHVARALADEANLLQLVNEYDPEDYGIGDMWMAIVFTGRRSTEVLELRLDCVGRLGGLPMFWHDQTKVGNFNDGIRIPETLYRLIRERQRKTLDRFEARHGHRPAPRERVGMALFPTRVTNLDGRKSISYNWFQLRFRAWVDGLDLGGNFVAHQARHTLATNLLRAGATLTHIRRYLGQVSDRMAEHYVHVSHSDLEEILHHVWVAGPGSAKPGEILSEGITAMDREQAMAMAVDLSRRSTPAEGGFCTFQPVVQGGACPWNLDCHNCDKFVLSGADLLYWRRKREQWASLAERAPDNATADYLHSVFAPTGQAIDGLEQALAGLGLLEDALALDMRKPQDYFQRIWNVAFRATDLAAAADEDEVENDDRAQSADLAEDLA